MRTLPDWKVIGEFPESEPIVGLQVLANRLFVATSKRMYEVIGDELRPLKMIYESTPDENP